MKNVKQKFGIILQKCNPKRWVKKYINCNKQLGSLEKEEQKFLRMIKRYKKANPDATFVNSIYKLKIYNHFGTHLIHDIEKILGSGKMPKLDSKYPFKASVSIETKNN